MTKNNIHAHCEQTVTSVKPLNAATKKVTPLHLYLTSCWRASHNFNSRMRHLLMCLTRATTGTCVEFLSAQTEVEPSPQLKTTFSGRDLWLLEKTRTQSNLVEYNCPYSVNNFTSPIWRRTLYLVCTVWDSRGKLTGSAVFWFAVMVQCRHQYLCISCDFTHDIPKGIHPNICFHLEKLHSELWCQKDTIFFCCPFDFFFSTVTCFPSSLSLSKNDYD